MQHPVVESVYHYTVLDMWRMLLGCLESCKIEKNRLRGDAVSGRIVVFAQFDVNPNLTGSGRCGEVVATYWSENGELCRYREVLCSED